MAEIIIHRNGKYNIYGTIADAPYFTEGCSLEQLKNWIEKMYGKRGLVNLTNRLARAHEKGTSSLLDDDLEETLLCNRAGENEANLSFHEFVERFL